MALSAQQVQAELQRKKNLGIAPTDPSHLGQYNTLTTKPPVTGVPAAASSAVLGRNKFGIPMGQPSGGSPVAQTVQSAFAAKNPTATGFMPKEFAYNYQSDPAYLAQKQNLEADAKTGTNNALVSLGSRGIGNSSSAVTAASQIQQAAVNRLYNDIIPQLEAQAYQRYNDSENRRYTLYRDEVGDKRYADETAYNHGRDDIADSRYTDETAYNRGRDTLADNRYDAETTYNHGRDALADKHYNDETVYSHKRDALADKRYTDETAYSHGRDKRSDMESDRSYNQSQSNTRSDNARADQNASYGRLMDIWQATGKAPAGMAAYGVTPGTPYGSGNSSSSSGNSSAADKSQIEQDYKDDYSSFISDPEGAYSWIKDSANAQSIINKYGTARYQELMKLVTPKDE